jgi:2-aminoadipate transaminase
MINSFPTVQLVLQPGVFDLGWGHPDPKLMPMEGMRQAASAASEQFGADMFAYGNAAGAGPLLAWLRERITQNEGRDPGFGGIAITGGNSLGLDQICTLLAKPGSIVLVESPTYHYAVKILRNHPFELVPVAADHNGLQIEALEAVLADLKRQGRQAQMLYCVPTYHNPTGACLSLERRNALIEIAQRNSFLIIEDDVYRDLSYNNTPPPSLWSMDRGSNVIRLGSFAKSLAPGLRLGWVTGDPDRIWRIADSGVLDSGGGSNHYAAMIVAAFCRAGRFEPHVASLRAAYAKRSHTLSAAFQTLLPDDIEVITPQGGFFTWINLPAPMATADLLPLAEAHGVSFIPGKKFFLHQGGERSVRLAHSLYPPEDLAVAAERFATAVQQLRKQ